MAVAGTRPPHHPRTTPPPHHPTTLRVSHTIAGQQDYSFALLGRREAQTVARALGERGIWRVVDPMAGTGLKLSCSLC